MLQISSKKFFTMEDVIETLHRGTFFTNYRIWGHETYETEAGRLLPSSSYSGMITLTCETTERLEKFHSDGSPSVLVSIGSNDMLQDFAAITSFALNITCTLDPELTRRLIAPVNMTLGVERAPNRYLSRIFDSEIGVKVGDADFLQSFMHKLMALDRKTYEAAMRAIRRYVVGTHRISDDTDLAYTLFVASIESLAQDFDGFAGDWAGFSYDRRLKVDEALAGIDEGAAAKLRAVLLEDEHRSLARRYKEFALAHIEPEFFREQAQGATRPIRRSDLPMLLDRAYAVRSQYLHRLRDIPRPVALTHDLSEVVHGDDATSLSFQGLARLAHHIILNFIERGRKVETEKFEWRSALPNIVRMQLASQYWVWQAAGYTSESANRYLSGFLDQIATVIHRTADGLSDLRPVLVEVERLVRGLQRAEQRRPMLLLHYLYNWFITKDLRSPDYLAFQTKYESDFEHPSIELGIAALVQGVDLDWKLEDARAVRDAYMRQRRRSQGLRLNQFFESSLTLAIAGLAQKIGDHKAALSFVSLSVEDEPGNAKFLELESRLRADPSHPFTWQQITGRMAAAS